MWKMLVLGCTLALAACATTSDDPLQRIVERADKDRPREITAACAPQVGSRLPRRHCLKHSTRAYAVNGNDALGAWWLDPAVSFH
jgi:hypothetical protein